MAAGPSFNCDNVEANSIEKMICKDDELSSPDRRLSIIYAAASKKATTGHPLSHFPHPFSADFHDLFSFSKEK
jgi:hypothetical protein